MAECGGLAGPSTTYRAACSGHHATSPHRDQRSATSQPAAMSALCHNPPSPALSPTSSPTPSLEVGVNLKTPNGTQAIYERVYPAELPSLDTLQQKYNQVSIRILERREFEALVLAIARVSGIDALEAELSRQVKAVVADCREALEDTKRDIILGGDVSTELLQLLPHLQQESFAGRTRVISRTLERLHESYQSRQISTTTPASPPSSTTRSTANVQATSEPSTRRRGPSKRTKTSSTLVRRQAGRVQKARQRPVEQIRRSTRLESLRRRDKLG